MRNAALHCRPTASQQAQKPRLAVRAELPRSDVSHVCHPSSGDVNLEPHCGHWAFCRSHVRGVQLAAKRRLLASWTYCVANGEGLHGYTRPVNS